MTTLPAPVQDAIDKGYNFFHWIVRYGAHTYTYHLIAYYPVDEYGRVRSRQVGVYRSLPRAFEIEQLINDLPRPHNPEIEPGWELHNAIERCVRYTQNEYGFTPEIIMYLYNPTSGPVDDRITTAVNFHRSHHGNFPPKAIEYRGAQPGTHTPTGLPIRPNNHLRAGDIAIITD